MKPGDFLLGVLDVFAVLLPGSLATWLISRYLTSEDLARGLSLGGNAGSSPPQMVPSWAAFLFASYMLGHFVFMAGSRLDGLYDRWRRKKKPADKDKAYHAAEALQLALTPGLVGGYLTTLKWSKAYVSVHAAHARVEIDRLEADSKFFRGMVIVLAAIALHYFVRERQLVLGMGALGLSVLSFHRYRDQRWKMTELIYCTAVIVSAEKGRAFAIASADDRRA